MKQNTLSYKIKQYLMFAGPGTILFLAVVIVPFVYGLYLTLTSWDGTSLSKPFVGMQNFAAAFKDTTYWQAMGRTMIYSVFAVILINVFAFALAYLVTSGVKGQNFFRAGFFVPNLIGGIVLGYVWQFVFNRAFVAIGKAITGGTAVSLLSTPNGAMFALIIVSVWQYA
ncbi:MAG: sugar ABC transporter permease, partial [Clostridia bacterium]|nr:sugar ABC transporter permease [Clostridia bacterium]